MTLKKRLDKLEHSTPDKQAHMDARELLQARFGRTDIETRERLLRAIREQVERRD